MSLGVWLRAARAPFFTATLVPVVLGSAVGWYDTGLLSWPLLILTALGATFIHAGANLANEYVDHLTGADEANPHRTRYSGGSGVIQDGSLSPRAVLFASVVAFCLGASIGLYLDRVTSGHVVLILGVVGVTLAYSYNGPPLMLGYRGFGAGEVCVGICFGPLLILGSYYVQAESLSLRALLVSLPPAVLISLVLLINGIPDYEPDRSAGKRTLAVMMGKARAFSVYRVLVWASLAAVAMLVAARVIPPACLVALLGAPLAWRVLSVSSGDCEDAVRLAPANAATIGLNAVVTILLAAGFVIDRTL